MPSKTGVPKFSGTCVLNRDPNQGGLPAKEVALGIGSLPFDPVEVLFSGIFEAGYQTWAFSFAWRGRYPSEAPVAVIAFAVEVDRQIDPVLCRSDLELPVVRDAIPVGTEEHLDDIPVPEFVSRAVWSRGEEQVKFLVRTAEQQIQVLIRPKDANLGPQVGIVERVGTVFEHFGRGFNAILAGGQCQNPVLAGRVGAGGPGLIGLQVCGFDLHIRDHTAGLVSNDTEYGSSDIGPAADGEDSGGKPSR